MKFVGGDSDFRAEAEFAAVGEARAGVPMDGGAVHPGEEVRGDGMDDAWQVQYFQPPNANAGPNADFDHMGQTNLFKSIAGLNPLDGSRFTLSIAPVSGQLTQKNLTFDPVVAGRTYTVTSKTDLTIAEWNAITVSAPSDSGTTRTVTDLNATGEIKFYRIEITKP